MEITLLLIGIIATLVVAIVVLVARRSSSTDSALFIKQDLTELGRSVELLKDSLQTSVSDRLEKSQEIMQQSMQKQLSESAKLVADVSTKLARLDETNRRVVDVTAELKTLQNVLQNPKQRGGVGEYYLDTVLGNVLPPGVYETQYKFKDGEIVDAIVKLDKGRIIPIDSKFSLENYNRLIDETDKTKREVIVKQFKIDLKNRIDETSKYIRPSENTLDYAFMFIPSEAIYYDLLVNNVGSTGTNSRDLIEYAFIDKKVIIVSPTTMLAYLQTVMQGLKSLQIESQAKDIQKRVGELSKHIAAHETYMQKLGNTLATTVGHYNNAHKSLEKMDKDVVKIAETTPGVDKLLVDKPLQDE
jgi:DNA recombination protein RmuC